MVGAHAPTRGLGAALFAGTRPEIVKTAPLLCALRAAGARVDFVATGQHHDHTMAGVFLEELDVQPAERWTLSGDEASRAGMLLAHALDRFGSQRPDVVIVQGDTWTVPLVALAARRHGIPVAHVEAGLRSHNPLSPEESNRIVASALANIHFAPTNAARENLRREGVPADRVHVVGNTGCDALRMSGVSRMPPALRSRILVTAHRSGTVDAPDRLAALLDVVFALADAVAPVTWPLHPRTADRLLAAGLRGRLDRSGVTVIEAQPYSRMLELIAGSALVVTDSGGLQEEAAWFGVPVVVLRNSTPRPEGVAAGQAILTGLDVQRALAAARGLASAAARQRIDALPCPYGDGHAAQRIAAVLMARHIAGTLALHEPMLEPMLEPTLEPALEEV